ncbi:MAG: Dihydrolipoyllysine-residue acetyltransferase, complex component [Bacteroidota bacterium]|jgi:pyruvate dehydrogenase E2 component (dihydrolipoamide acetyltransferase)
MAEVIQMPRMSDTMTEGVIVAWHKKIGDKVKSGDLLAEVETDKATMELESYNDGTLLYIGVEAGKAVAVNGILAIVGAAGEDYAALLNAAPTVDPNAPTAATENKQEVVLSNVSHPTSHISSDDRIKASPLAKAIAAEKGIDLHSIKGSADNGRIVKRDLENVSAVETQVASIVAAAPMMAGAESFEEVTLSQMRKTIARRLSESNFTAPHFFVTIEANMANAMAFRKQAADAGIKFSFNDLMIKAVASAIRKHPKVNSSWLGDKIRYNHHIHIGMAVGMDEGLVVPVLKFADQKSISQISMEAKQFVEKAKSKKIQPADMQGNTFTISNMGMFDVENFTAIINPPDACILAVGKIKETPIVENGEIKIGHVMKMTLSSDHRVVDGSIASGFLKSLKENLENPAMMLI